MAELLQTNPATDGPGVRPTWTQGNKDGVGTARSLSSQVWFTVANGILSEVYYPNIDSPQVRDLQLLFTDGSTFFHDITRDFSCQCELIDPDALGLRLTHTANGQPYQVVQEVISEPGSPCVLIRTTLVGQPAFLNLLRVYLLVAPHLEGRGAGNSGFVATTARGKWLTAYRGNTWLAAGADCGFAMTSCGFVGVNDGWHDIVGLKRLPLWQFNCALNGNIALTGEINLKGKTEFVVGLAFGQGREQSPNGAIVALAEALSYPFDAPSGQYSHLQAFLEGWKKSDQKASRFKPAPQATFDQANLFNVSRNILLSHEDKVYNGALVASLSIPWGEVKGDEQGGYHLVWPRDMCQSATALLAAGEIDLPLRGLMYLAASQSSDGKFLQNFYINGTPYFPGTQLDELSAPIILAYRLSEANALQLFDPRPMVLAAAGALIANGPMTQQDRWEENEGYSPSTLASNIAGLVCAAYFAEQQAADHATAQFLLEYADFLESHIESWCVTDQGSLLPGVPRHYIRILPTQVKSDGNHRFPSAPEDPNNAILNIHNRDNVNVPAKNVIDAGFLELVRYGIRKGGDPLIEDSLRVVDACLKDILPNGPCFRRYNEDGYGQHDDGGPFVDKDVNGVGRPWPLLTGERGHYELAAGGDAKPYVQAMEKFAVLGRLLAEQLWNSHAGPFAFGTPTGSAVPLAWAHAEYIKLVRSVSDGKVFDLIQIVADRYLQPHAASVLEIWNFDRQITAMSRGKRLRIPLPVSFRLHWTSDAWNTVNDTPSTATAVGIHYVDIATDQHTTGPLQFTFYWVNTMNWEGRNYQVQLI